jgi:hypothetical protein
VDDYTGVKINALAAETGRVLNPAAHILCGDSLDLSENEIRERRFNVVFLLSCVDWNVRFADMLSAAWSRVLPGGHLVAASRLIDAQGCNDLDWSYQYINFDRMREGERASYVVSNARNWIRKLVTFDPNEINAFGYWGVPSVTAVTPFEQLCFSGFAIRKRSGDAGVVRFALNLSAEMQVVMGFSNQ